MAAISFGEFLTPLFFYVVIAAYVAFVVVSAWQFSRRPEPGRAIRGINLTLVPLGVLVALVGVLAASFNAFNHQEGGPPSTTWAIVMVALGLGGSSLVLAVEGLVLRGRVPSSSEERRAIGLRSLSLIATTVPLVVLGALFVALSLKLA